MGYFQTQSMIMTHYSDIDFIYSQNHVLFAKSVEVFFDEKEDELMMKRYEVFVKEYFNKNKKAKKVPVSYKDWKKEQLEIDRRKRE